MISSHSWLWHKGRGRWRSFHRLTHLNQLTPSTWSSQQAALEPTCSMCVLRVVRAFCLGQVLIVSFLLSVRQRYHGDLWPISLTFVILQTFERFITISNRYFPASVDSLQFVHDMFVLIQKRWSCIIFWLWTKGVGVSAPDTFSDFSSTFNTIQSYRLAETLSNRGRSKNS